MSNLNAKNKSNLSSVKNYTTNRQQRKITETLHKHSIKLSSSMLTLTVSEAPEINMPVCGRQDGRTSLRRCHGKACKATCNAAVPLCAL